MKRSFVILLTYGVATSAHEILRHFAFYRDFYRHFPFYVPESLDRFIGVALCAGVAFALYGPGDHFALRRGFARAMLVGLVVSSPMLIGFALTRFMAVRDLAAVGFLTMFSPLVEEIMSRGFAFRLLYRQEKWPLWTAVMAIALMTGAEHIEKGQTPGEIIGLFVLTGAGGAVFSWLLARWNSLWFPFAVHMFMNLWWEIFRVSHTALGGWLPFVMQSATIILALLVTARFTPGLRRRTNDQRPAAGGLPNDHSLRAAVA